MNFTFTSSLPHYLPPSPLTQNTSQTYYYFQVDKRDKKIFLNEKICNTWVSFTANRLHILWTNRMTCCIQVRAIFCLSVLFICYSTISVKSHWIYIHIYSQWMKKREREREKGKTVQMENKIKILTSGTDDGKK